MRYFFFFAFIKVSCSLIKEQSHGKQIFQPHFWSLFFNKSAWNLVLDYWSENTYNDIFQFSVNVIELEFQLISFLVCHFHHLYQKIATNADFNYVFSNIGWFNRKMVNTVRFPSYKYKNIYNLYAFMIKTDFRNMSKNRRFRWKNRAKPSQSAHFATFFTKKHFIWWKTLVNFM